MRFHAYVLVEGGTVEFEVQKKLRTDVHGHYTYMLKGVTDKGHCACAVVNKSQYEQFDVPSEERVVKKSLQMKRRVQRISEMKPIKKRKGRLVKSMKKCLDEDIEKWLADHADLDMSKLDGLS